MPSKFVEIRHPLIARCSTAEESPAVKGWQMCQGFLVQPSLKCSRPTVGDAERIILILVQLPLTHRPRHRKGAKPQIVG